MNYQKFATNIIYQNLKERYLYSSDCKNLRDVKKKKKETVQPKKQKRIDELLFNENSNTTSNTTYIPFNLKPFTFETKHFL